MRLHGNSPGYPFQNAQPPYVATNPRPGGGAVRTLKNAAIIAASTIIPGALAYFAGSALYDMGANAPGTIGWYLAATTWTAPTDWAVHAAVIGAISSTACVGFFGRR